MEFRTLFSSSSGNCQMVSGGDTTLLVDAGVSCSRIVQAVAQAEREMGEIGGVLVTHEHSDHVKGISVLCRKFGIPVYANRATWQAMQIDKKEMLTCHFFENETPFVIGDLEILPFSTPHDAVSSVGFRLTDGKTVVGMATDMGCVTDEVREQLTGSQVAYIESNHDRNMLLNGAYPYALKRRILSDHGHLCNDDCGTLACQLVESGTEHLVLGHLSKENNMPDIAYMTCREALSHRQMREWEDYTLDVAMSSCNGELIRV